MKACLMKVNYDPKYTKPHLSNQKSNISSLYINESNREHHDRVIRKSLAEEARRRLQELKLSDEIDYVKNLPERPISASQSALPANNKKEIMDAPSMSNKPLISGTVPASNVQPTLRLRPVLSLPRKDPTAQRLLLKMPPIQTMSNNRVGNVSPLPTYTSSTPIYNYVSPYGSSSVQTQSHQNHIRHSRISAVLSSTFPLFGANSNAQVHSQKSMKDLPTLLRSRTMPNNGSVNNGSSNNMHLPDIERRARVEADKAIKERKVFAIVGPYNSLRKSLRRRGWVEKFSDDVIQSLQTKPHTADNDSHRAYPPLRPWEEEGGIYGIMSRLVRNCTPTFVFTVKSVDVDPRVVKSGQLVNHFGKTAHITTKSGLSQNLKNLHWYDLEDADNFYPRCYRLDDIEERDAFKDDFLITAAIGFLKHFMELYGPHDSKWKRHKVNESGDTFNDQPEEAAELKNESKDAEKEPSHDEHGTFTTKGPSIPIQALDMALSFCESYCRKKDHDDIDVIVDSKTPFQSQIDCFLTWFYLFAHSNGEVFGIADTHVKQCSEMLDKISVKWPQFQLDGYQNVWILKPGAKSRGRGIQLMGKLQDILHALESGESCLVIQKYIERPLLIYKTKFDIRQWFLVTDWNPVTIWFYRDCYLRFCSQEYSLADFNVAIHLSNNSVQKHFQNGKRSNKLPDDNMWTREEFSQYLGETGQKHLWTSRTLAGMKSAIISAVLCTQESIEGRKSAFELYGADFMLDEDFFPWLLEINSSPSMAQTTHVTKVLVENVLEDTLKVVLDRRNDKNCDTGGFEMIYKQTAQVEPVMSDTNLSIQGHKMFIKRTQ